MITQLEGGKRVALERSEWNLNLASNEEIFHALAQEMGFEKHPLRIGVYHHVADKDFCIQYEQQLVYVEIGSFVADKVCLSISNKVNVDLILNFVRDCYFSSQGKDRSRPSTKRF